MPSYVTPVKLAPGAQLGPYRVLEPLGGGGMGEVYRAHDTRLGRDVALKVIAEKLDTQPDALGRFEREVRTIASLAHPNILALYDVGQDADTVYAITELLEGESLDRRLARGIFRCVRPWKSARPLPKGSRRRTHAGSSIAT